MARHWTTDLLDDAPVPGPLKAIHRWLAEPSVPLDDERFELFPVTSWAMALGLVSHVAFLALFLALDVPVLAALNVVSVAVFAAALWLARRAHLTESLLLASSEVIVHGVLATWWLGWSASFHYHIVLAMILTVLFSIIDLRVRIPLVAGMAGVYVLLAFGRSGAAPIQALGADVDRALTVINTVVFLSVLAGMCLYYTWTVRVTRQGRDRAEAELRAALERTRELDRLKTDFTSMVSHELRTPLTSILGFAKVTRGRLEDRILPLVPEEDRRVSRAVAQVRENLGIVVSEGERLTALINDLLDIAKMEAGQMEYAREPVVASELVERAAAACSGLFTGGGLDLVREIEPDLPAITGDRDRLLQVLVNLVSNAAKFTPDGSVTVRAHAADGGVAFEVVDTGVGIAEAEQAHVFEKFRQVGTLDDRPRGTGLGLAICRQIVQAHGGRIAVASKLGEGTRFWFVVPTA